MTWAFLCENGEVKDLILVAQGRTDDPLVLQPDVGSQIHGGACLHGGFLNLFSESAYRLGGVHPVLLPRRLQGVQRIARDELREDLFQGLVGSEGVTPHHLAVDHDHDPHLVLHDFEVVQVVVEVTPFLLVDVAHGRRLGKTVKGTKCMVDILPHSALMGPVTLPPLERLLYVGELPGPHLRGHHSILASKDRPPIRPPPLLHAGDGDDNGPLGPDEDGGVDDSVLLGPHQLLAVQNQHITVGIVDNPQLGNASSLIDLGDLYGPVLQGLIQGQVIR